MLNTHTLMSFFAFAFIASAALLRVIYLRRASILRTRALLPLARALALR